jgi:hypothetical protein
MPLLLPLKLLMTPLLIALVTGVGRKWGPGIGGWLMGFPLTSGPISALLALQYGKSFAAGAAVGTLGGQASVCVFCLTYCWVSQVAGWPVSAVVAVLAFLGAVFCWNLVALPLLPTFALVVLVCTGVLLLIPNRPCQAQAGSAPKWDLPMRMLAAATFVVLLTTAANSLGAHLSGLLSPFPIFGTVIAAFTHYQQGPTAAGQLLRGVVTGSFAFAVFFLVVGALLPITSAWLVYTAATAASIVINSLALRFLQTKAQPVQA